MKQEIVLGPPGTGKTTTLLKRVDEELAAGTPPSKIGYVSFTRRAADEAVSRACEKFCRDRKEFRWFRTIHSLCFQHLGYRSDDVLQGTKLNRDFANYARTKIESRWDADVGGYAGVTPGARALHLDNLARIKMVDPLALFDAYPEDPGVSRPEFIRIVRCLRAFKKERGLVDFTDMLEEFVASKSTIDLEVLFVDEAQDLSKLQWEVVKLLADNSHCRRVVIAGDDDQAIYGWSGADLETFLSLEGDQEVLGQSYRVPRAVQRVADLLISKVKRRFPKEWEPRDDEGELDRCFEVPDLRDETDVLILARNNFILIEMEGELRRRGVLYKIGERCSVAASTADAIVYWERLRSGRTVTGAEARKVYAKMSARKGVAHGHKTIKGVEDEDEVDLQKLKTDHGLLVDGPWFEALDLLTSEEVAYIKTALQAGESLTKPPRVRLQTIHGAKGGEADHVVLMLEVARKSYEQSLRNPDEELRVWYVGVTRAKRKLTMVEAPGDMRCRWL